MGMAYNKIKNSRNVVCGSFDVERLKFSAADDTYLVSRTYWIDTELFLAIGLMKRN